MFYFFDIWISVWISRQMSVSVQANWQRNRSDWRQNCKFASKRKINEYRDSFYSLKFLWLILLLMSKQKLMCVLAFNYFKAEHS